MKSVILHLLATVLALCLGSIGAMAHCYPGTPENPLEKEVIFNSNGGRPAQVRETVFFKRFEEECGVKVILQESPARTIAQLVSFVQTGQAPFDLTNTLTPIEYEIGRQEGFIEKLPEGFWDPIRDKMLPESISDYGVWGNLYTTVMIYSTQAFPNGLANWADFWDVKKYPGPRILQNDPTNIVFALQAAGLAPSEVHPLTPEKIALAFQKLEEIRPELPTFWKPGDQPIQGIRSGEFVAGTAWVGRAAVARKEGAPLDINWQGGILNDSWLYILKGAKNPRAAQALMFFMQRPDLVAESAREIGYAGGQLEVNKYLEPEVMAALPTSPEHVSIATLLDMDWWIKNGTQIGSIWNTWVATGTAPAFAE